MRPRPHLSPRRHTHLSEHQLSRREASVYVGDLAIPRLPRGTCYLLQTGGGGVRGPLGSSSAGMSGPRGKGDPHPASGVGSHSFSCIHSGIKEGGGGRRRHLKNRSRNSCLRPSKAGPMARRRNLPKVTRNRTGPGQAWAQGLGRLQSPLLPLDQCTFICGLYTYGEWSGSMSIKVTAFY